MRETILTAEPVKKPSLEDEEKIAIGQKLAAILRKYPNSRLLRAAQVPVTLSVYVKPTKNASKGNIIEMEGTIEGIDFTQNRVVLEGRRVKLGDIVKVVVPSEFEEEEYGEDDYTDFDEEDTHWQRSADQTRMTSSFREIPFSTEYRDYFGDDVPDSFPDYESGEPERRAEPQPARKTILYSSKDKRYGARS